MLERTSTSNPICFQHLKHSLPQRRTPSDLESVACALFHRHGCAPPLHSQIEMSGPACATRINVRIVKISSSPAPAVSNEQSTQIKKREQLRPLLLKEPPQSTIYGQSA